MPHLMEDGSESSQVRARVLYFMIDDTTMPLDLAPPLLVIREHLRRYLHHHVHHHVRHSTYTQRSASSATSSTAAHVTCHGGGAQ
jgi:hypothetical protein